MIFPQCPYLRTSKAHDFPTCSCHSAVSFAPLKTEQGHQGHQVVGCQSNKATSHWVHQPSSDLWPIGHHKYLQPGPVNPNDPTDFWVYSCTVCKRTGNLLYQWIPCIYIYICACMDWSAQHTTKLVLCSIIQRNICYTVLKSKLEYYWNYAMLRFGRSSNLSKMLV